MSLIYKTLQENPRILTTFPGFLIAPEKLIFYFGKTHLGIEYVGKERIDSLPEKFEYKVIIFDYTESNENFLEQIIGIKYDDGSSKKSLPLGPYLEDLIMPTNRGYDKLRELNWHFEAQDSMIAFNMNSPVLIPDQFTRIINGLFFDSNEYGLQTRHIKWMDFLPAQYNNLDHEFDSFTVNFSILNELVDHDCRYVYSLPKDYDFQNSKLQRINRLLELVGNNKTSETEITRFLADPDNQFILTMRFGAVSILAEATCHWQSVDKDPIKPDFFLIQTNGYADIIEFKLPTAEVQIVGRDNRETFSSKLNSYISQTRTYRTYFDDPKNREWFEQTYKFKVYKPRRILVIGRRWEVNTEIIREIITDYQDLEIITFDDLVDGVVAQLYM